MKQSSCNYKIVVTFILIVLTLLVGVKEVFADPTGPVVTLIKNETKQLAGAATINTTGGSITTVILNATAQNYRWKAFVGNVTGSLTLDDASDNTVFDWTITDVIGEVYATRSETAVNWSGINCSSAGDLDNEQQAMNHSNKDDNLTATFNDLTHQGFFVGTREILSNTCYSVNTYVNSSTQQSSFEEVVLYDSAVSGNGNIVYATPLEQDSYGFDNNSYDFQMIVPENGLATFTGATAYYFYVELT